LGIFKKEPIITDERLDSVAIIMDGNGRWATRRGLPRTAGHAQGARIIQGLLEYFRKIGVHYITLYAFSTENWKRPEGEVNMLMELIYKYLDEVVIPKINEDKDFSMKFLGDKSRLSEKLRNKCIEIEEMAKDRPFVCNLALNYGGRDEILSAVNSAIKDGETEITAKTLEARLYTAGTPDPDLIIRTGGEYRISNFLLWQSAYSEYIILDTLWPDFSERDIDECVRRFYKRRRRFGGLDKEETKKQRKREK
jgi:undecaprenyl diphosphate synthase